MRHVSNTGEGVWQTYRLPSGYDRRLGSLLATVGQPRSDALSVRGLRSGWWRNRNSAELHTNREIVSKELAVVDERFKLLTNRIRELLQEKSCIEEELGKIREKKTNANLEYQEQEQVLIDARNQLESYNQKYLQLEGENEKRQEKLQQVRDRIEYLNIKHGRMQTLHSDRLVQTENFEQKRILNEKHIGALEKHIKETHKDIKDLEGNIASDQQMYKNTEEELADLNDNLRLIQDRKSYLSEEKSKLLEESTRFSAQIDVLKAANANFIGYADGTRSILEAAKTSKLTGVLGPLNNQLSVDEEFENAVSAALGDYFDGVVFDNGVDEALNLLIAHSEKGVLLPLANFNESANDYRNDILEEDGVFGSAVELISVSDGCAPIIRTLLGSTYIVDDRDSARRILKNYKHNYSPSPNSAPDIRLVTLIGEIFHLNGPVLSGISSQDKEAQSLVSRKRRFETLTENLNQITGLIEHTELNLDDVSLDEKRLLNKENIINSEYINLREIIDERSSKLKNLTLELNHSKDKLLWQQEELQDLVNNRSRVKEEIMDISAQISKIDRQISEEQNRYKQLSAENSSHILDDVSASVAHWEKTIAITEQTKHEIDKRISEFQYLSNNTKSQLQSIEEQIKLLNNQISDLEDEKINKRDRELILEKEISKIQSQLSPAESDLGKIEGAQIQIQSKESEVRRELSKAEHQNAQARILLAAKREAVDALRQRIEADIGLVDFDYSESVSGPTPLPIEGYVNQLPHIEQLSPELEISLNRQRALLRRIGPINPEAQAEYKEVNTRFSFLTEQMADLQEAENDIRQVINELDTLMEQEFRKTFEHVSLEFKTIFTRLFNGGDADLILTEPNNFSVSGIDIEARLPGRRPQRLSLLSGGERSLTATALIFALLKVSPTPFCLLDEVDAMLDEANLDRFREMLMELSKETQFVVVTHNRNTVQAADVIYGVTMGRDSASQVVSLKPAELVEG